LGGGAVGEPPVLFAEDIFQNEVANFCQKWPQNVTGCPEMAFANENGRKNNIDV
jgi:hypothetical protein